MQHMVSAHPQEKANEEGTWELFAFFFFNNLLGSQDSSPLLMASFSMLSVTCGQLLSKNIKMRNSRNELFISLK